jgi:hypothetical protein
MIARMLLHVSDVRLTSLALLDLRHVLHEGLLSHLTRDPELRRAVVSTRHSELTPTLFTERGPAG